MKIGVAGPVDISTLRDLFSPESEIPRTYSFPLISTLAREFYVRGHEVVLFALSSEVRATRRIEGERIQAYICPLRRPRWQMLDFFRVERQELRDAMRASGCEVVHAHWTYEFGSAAVDSGLPHIITAHDVPMSVLRYARNPYWLEKPWLAVSVLRKARCVTAVSPYLARQLERFLRPQKDVVVIPNGVAPEVFSLRNRRASQPDQKIVFASVLNGWGPLKNGKALIDAFAIVKKQSSGQVLLKMLGDGFEKDGPAHRWAKKRNADVGIEFVGFRPHAEVLRTLAEEVDVLVHPSRDETFCMAALEAMAIGVPVIGGREAGAIPWLLDGGKRGELVDVCSARDLADAMMAFSRDRLWAVQRTPLARSAMQEKFSLSAVVDSYERLCRSQIQ